MLGTLWCEGFMFMAYTYDIETMAQLCISAMMEGLRLRALGSVIDGAYNVNQNYIVVGFDLYDSGEQGSELNEPWEAQA